MKNEKVIGVFLGLGVLALIVLLSTFWNNTYYTYSGLAKMDQQQYEAFSQKVSENLPQILNGRNRQFISYENETLRYDFFELTSQLPKDFILTKTDPHKTTDMQMIETFIFVGAIAFL